jgi:hypothetical protein
VSDGEFWERKVVAGSGTGSSETGESYVAMLADAELMIKLDIAGSGEKWMGVLRDMGDQGDFVIGEAGEELEMLDPSIVQNMEVINLPGQVAVEYWGSCALVEVQDLLAAAGVEAHG